MIIIEGMDNSGKSTFADALADGLYDRTSVEWTLRKSPGLRLGREEMLRWLLHQLNGPLQHRLILDRWPFISESVYGPIVRGVDVISEEPMLTTLMANWLEMRSLVIYCRPPTQYIVDTTKDEMPGVVEHSRELLAEYDRMAVDLMSMEQTGEFKGHFMVYDWTADDREAVFDAIAGWLNWGPIP